MTLVWRWGGLVFISDEAPWHYVALVEEVHDGQTESRAAPHASRIRTAASLLQRLDGSRFSTRWKCWPASLPLTQTHTSATMEQPLKGLLPILVLEPKYTQKPSQVFDCAMKWAGRLLWTFLPTKADRKLIWKDARWAMVQLEKWKHTLTQSPVSQLPGLNNTITLWHELQSDTTHPRGRVLQPDGSAAASSGWCGGPPGVGWAFAP